jgi:superfamily II DNA or RNA helicase
MKIKLKQHQLNVYNHMKDNFGLILYHSTGTGKTITSLATMNQFDHHIIIIGPKSSKKAFSDELKQLKLNESKFTILSYAKVKKLMYNDINMFKNKCVIVDEAHNLRNETRDNMFLTGILGYAYKILLLSATPIINYLNDISPLINIIKGDVLPTDRKQFNFFYFDEANLRIDNEKLLRDKISNTISYYKKDDKDNYPESGTIEKTIIMSNEQIKEYEKYVKKILFFNQVPPEGQSLFEFDFNTINTRQKNAFMSATRQLSNTIDGDITMPKIVSIVNEVKKGPFPAVVYSNFLKNGVYPISKKLEFEGITNKLITGNTSNDKIIKTVNDYNDGKFQVLLLSSAGSESLDLKNTRQIHIMEPHWNEPKIKQVIGRAIRYKSHSKLPPNERNVTIYKWMSVFDKTKYANISADEYLIELSNKKTKIFEVFEQILIDVSIENKVDKLSKMNRLSEFNKQYYKKQHYKKQYKKYARRYKELKKITN